MYRLNHFVRVAALGAIVALSACADQGTVLGPKVPAGGSIFASYVALGNSITAGFQSNGINDSTQRQSYARVLAGQMGTQYHYASLAGRGCTPPIANGLTGALSGTGSTATTCDLRAAASVTDVLNNVAVPGARVLDPTSSSTVASNALTTFILGGKTQVQKALEAKPTFASIWIGNNDVLQAGLSGMLNPQPGVSPGIVSTLVQFQTSYDLMIKQLLDSAPALKGVLIGVVQVAGVASMSLGSVVQSQNALISFATGKPVVIDPNCTGSTSLINVPQLVAAIRSGTHPPAISCAVTAVPAPNYGPGVFVGDIFVLDPAEQTTLSSAISAYNTYISGKAAAIGFAYYDVNVLLAAQKAAGKIPLFPNFGSSTATYGTLFSLDAVHPSGAAHLLIANDLITTINAKYGTTLTAAQ
jgi:lysophospholipase L1-like esterase